MVSSVDTKSNNVFAKGQLRLPFFYVIILNKSNGRLK